MSRARTVVQLVQGVRRRRRRTLAEKITIVQESRATGSSVLEAARRHAVNPTQVYKWRRQLDEGALGASWPSGPGPARLMEVRVSGEPFAATSASCSRTGPEGRIEISLADGVRIAICGSVGVERLEQVLGALRR